MKILADLYTSSGVFLTLNMHFDYNTPVNFYIFGNQALKMDLIIIKMEITTLNRIKVTFNKMFGLLLHLFVTLPTGYEAVGCSAFKTVLNVFYCEITDKH